MAQAITLCSPSCNQGSCRIQERLMAISIHTVRLVENNDEPTSDRGYEAANTEVKMPSV